MSCGCGCTESICGSISVGLYCYPNMVQGNSFDVILQFVGSDKLALDISTFLSFEINVYDIRDLLVKKFIYPDNGVDQTIDILQTFDSLNNIFTNKGKIQLFFNAIDTAMFLSGPITLELIMTSTDADYNDSIKTFIITCLFLGNIKYSKNYNLGSGSNEYTDSTYSDNYFE
jgi:hypothetical protein